RSLCIVTAIDKPVEIITLESLIRVPLFDDNCCCLDVRQHGCLPIAKMCRERDVADRPRRTGLLEMAVLATGLGRPSALSRTAAARSCLQRSSSAVEQEDLEAPERSLQCVPTSHRSS